ncbi:MAG: metallophosphoesterase [Eubacteriales bacterium]|nr:metallophosphoesterase [Eubacteriales bacterium]
MPLQYFAYEEELETFYRRLNSFGWGRCFQINGLPGAGLDLFVKSFVQKYGPILKNQQNIYCSVIQCPKDYPINLFVRIVREMNILFHDVFREVDLPEERAADLSILEECCNVVSSVNRETEISYEMLREYVLKSLGSCGSFRKEINVRLFITGFDNARLLFNRDVDYAMLFKEVCENYTEWLGITITSHRTLDIIALAVKAFSEFASLFDPISIEGFSDARLKLVYEQVESVFGIVVTETVREKLLYYCGNNPRRLSILFNALSDLQSDLGADQWSLMSGEALVDHAYRLCRRQMDEHMMRIMRSVQDIQGDGMTALETALKNPSSTAYSIARKPLFDMKILLSRKNSAGYITAPAIPVMKEMIENILEREEICADSNVLRILHLSDMHFGSDKNDSERELRKAYIHSFKEHVAQICQKKVIDYIFITGDIGWEARKKDYTEAEMLIRDLMEICQLDSDRLFLCPGNHDVERELLEDIHYPENQKVADKYLSLEKLDKHAGAFRNYTAFCRRLGCTPYSVGHHTGYLTGVQFCENFTIVCLNTAWFSKNDATKKVWIGKTYAVAIKNEIADRKDKTRKVPVVTLMHHPVKEWEEEECFNYRYTTNTWEIVSRMSDLILCGHTHETSDLKNMVNDAKIFNGGVFYHDFYYDNSFYMYELSDQSVVKTQHTCTSGKWREWTETFDC